MDLREFAAKMRRRARDIPTNLNAIKIDVGKAVLESVANDTPADKGTAISNWQVGLDTADFQPIPAFVPGTKGSSKAENVHATIAAGTSTLVRSKAGQVIHITNVLPYIKKLNEGWSAQAPKAFVETAVKRGLERIKGAKVIKE